MADLVPLLQRQFPHIRLPNTLDLYSLAILLHVDAFASLPIARPPSCSRCELLKRGVSAIASTCPSQNPKSWHSLRPRPKAVPAPISPGPSGKISPPLGYIHTIAQVPTFIYLGLTLGPRLTFTPHCTHIINRIWRGHHKLAAARSCPRSPLRFGPATTLFRLWHSTVATHALTGPTSSHTGARPT